MRDLQRLEELSSTAALGLWADDIVLALHRSAAGTAEATDKALLSDAAVLLEGALTKAEAPAAAPSSARALAATDTALTAIAVLAQDEAEERDESEFLTELIGTLREAAAGQLANDQRTARVVKFFATVGQLQLTKSNSVLASRKDPRTWTATPQTSSFS